MPSLNAESFRERRSFAQDLIGAPLFDSHQRRHHIFVYVLEVMASKDIYKEELDFAVLALQSPAFNKL